MKRSGIFLFISLSFIIGIAVGLLGRHDFLIIYCLVIANLILLTSFWRNINLRVLFLGLLFLFAGIFRSSINIRLSENIEKNVSRFYGKEIMIKGFVSENPRKSSDWQIFKLKINNGQEIQGGIMIYANLYPEYDYGMEMTVRCKLAESKSVGNYRYDKYLMAEGIYSTCYYPKIEAQSRNHGNYLVKKLFLLKEFFVDLVRKNVRAPEAEILSAILLGDKDGISKEARDLFSRAGISHIIAISGMHMAIFAVIILYFLIFLGVSRKGSFYICAFIISLYVIMIAAPVSAARAALMSFVALLAIKLGRLSKFVNILNLTVCLMLVLQPAILFYDIGFQLSFMALLGIIFLNPIIKRTLEKYIAYLKNSFKTFFGKFRAKTVKNEDEYCGIFRRVSNGLRPKFAKSKSKVIFEISSNTFEPVKDMVSISLAAEIFVLPLVIYYFGLISLSALFVNLAVIWLMPIIMALGTFFLLIGLLNLFLPLLFLVKIVGLVIGIFLSYLIWIASLLTPSWTVLNIAKFPLWGVMLCYISLGLIVYFFH